MQQRLISDRETKPAEKPSRRRVLKRLLGGAAALLGGSAYACGVEPFWIEEHDVAMPLRKLPAEFDGFRIVQLTDLHASDAMPFAYLRRVVARVNELKPDLVAVTGDIVSHNVEWIQPVSDLLGTLRPPVMACLGNHDYDTDSSAPRGAQRVAERLERALASNGVQVLRNQSACIKRGDGKLWIVGLEDLWSGRFSPPVAMADVPAGQCVIALSHNPDTAPVLDAYGIQLTLAGHTHGGQICIPGYGPLLMNVQNRQFLQGRVDLANGCVYISRGVGYLKPVRVFCRPELPCFVLKCGG